MGVRLLTAIVFRVGVSSCLIVSGSVARAAEPELVEATGDRSRGHFQRGAALVEERKYEEAAGEFEASYELEPTKQALFAWAQVERLRGNCARAIALYRKFTESPDLTPTQQEAAALNIRRCERALAEAAAPPPIPPPAPSSPPAAVVVAPPPALPAASGSALLPTLLGGGAAVALGAAGTFYWYSLRDERVAQNQSLEPDGTFDVYYDAVVRARRRQRIAAGLLGGGVLLGGGALLSWLLPRAGGRQVAAWVGPGTGGLVIGGAL